MIKRLFAIAVLGVALVACTPSGGGAGSSGGAGGAGASGGGLTSPDTMSPDMMSPETSDDAGMESPAAS